MFGKNEDKFNKIDTLIGKNTKLQGKIESKGSMRIDGELVGDIIIEGSVVIGEEGKINGNISCDNIFIAGSVHGNILCKDQLRVSNTGKLYGDIEVKSFIVDESAVFEGSCKMIFQNHTGELTKEDIKTSKKGA